MKYQKNSGNNNEFSACPQGISHLPDIFNHLGAAIIIISQEGKIQHANDKALTLYDYTHEQMTGLDFAKLGAQVASHNVDTVKIWLKTTIDTGELSVEWLARNKLGQHFWVEVIFSKIEYNTQQMVLALITDISRMKAVQWTCEACERKYQALINAMPDVIFHVNNNGKILACTTSHNEKLVLPAEELVGKYLSDVMPHKLAHDLLMSIMLVLSNRESQVIEYAMPLMEKCTYHEARIVYLNYTEAMMICRDITERKHSELELKYMSYHDPLTGLYNRAFFENEAKRAILGARVPLALIVCDVDGLKITNDTLGHEAGDRLLKAAAETLQQAVPDNVVLSRIGGDEFVVLMLNASKAEVERVCQRIQQKITEFNEARKGLPLSISIGHAASNGVTNNLKELFKEADDNMYKAKLHRNPIARSTLSPAIAEILKISEFEKEGFGGF